MRHTTTTKEPIEDTVQISVSGGTLGRTIGSPLQWSRPEPINAPAQAGSSKWTESWPRAGQYTVVTEKDGSTHWEFIDAPHHTKNCDTCVEWRDTEMSDPPKGAECPSGYCMNGGPMIYYVRYLFIGKNVLNPDSVYQYRVEMRDRERAARDSTSSAQIYAMEREKRQRDKLGYTINPDGSRNYFKKPETKAK
jgi:hypothetical protein